jgi:hypothetical protein
MHKTATLGSMKPAMNVISMHSFDGCRIIHLPFGEMAQGLV